MWTSGLHFAGPNLIHKGKPMALNPASYHQANMRQALSLGDNLISADATFVPQGFESARFVVKQFPDPKVSGGTEIEVAHAGGGSIYRQAPFDAKFTGGFMMYENVAGTAQRFVEDVMARGGYFDARIYEGTPERNYSSKLVVQCFVRLDPTDRDWENRQQVVMISGTIFGHYYGQTFRGNI